MVFASDFSGYVYCLDALTGEEYWIYDTKGHIWASPFVADGKVFIGNEDGFLVDRSLDAITWQEGIASLSVNSSSYSDSGLNGSTTYYYRVRAYNAQGDNTSNVDSATTDSPPPFEDAVSDADWFVSGSVQDSHTATHAIDDGRVQIITEIRSGFRSDLHCEILALAEVVANIRGH